MIPDGDRNHVLIKSTPVVYVLVMVALRYYWCRLRLLRNGICLQSLIFARNFSEESSRKYEMDLSWECFLNYKFRCQYIFSLMWSNLFFSWWKKKGRKKEKKIFKKSKEQKSMPFVFFWWGSFAVHIGHHLRFGIICGSIWGSFPLWVSFAVGDHLRHCTQLWEEGRVWPNSSYKSFLLFCHLCHVILDKKWSAKITTSATP